MSEPLRLVSDRLGQPALGYAEAFRLSATGELWTLPAAPEPLARWQGENLYGPGGEAISGPVVVSPGGVAVQFGPRHELNGLDDVRFSIAPHVLPGGGEQLRLSLFASQTHERLIATGNGLVWLSGDKAWKAKEILICPPGYVYDRDPLPAIAPLGARQRLSPLASRVRSSQLAR